MSKENSHGPLIATTIELAGREILMYLNEREDWFLSHEQVGQLFGRSKNTIYRHYVNYKSDPNSGLEEGRHWLRCELRFRPRQVPDLILWTREGLVWLGDHIKSTKATAVLNALGVNTRHKPRTEDKWISTIERALAGITEVHSRYKVGSYVVDMYFPQLNIALEIDERGHESYNDEAEKAREGYIRETLGCSFIRINSSSQSEDVGDAINRLFLRHLEVNGLTR